MPRFRRLRRWMVPRMVLMTVKAFPDRLDVLMFAPPDEMNAGDRAALLNGARRVYTAGVKDWARAEAGERVLQKLCPELYEDQTDG